MFYIPVLLFYIFPPFLAYTVNTYLITLAAFFGMYLLSSRFLIRDDNTPIISVAVAVCVACLPTYFSYGLSVVGIPLLTYALLTIYFKQARFIHWLIIVIFPFYSVLALSGVMILMTLGVFFVWDAYYFKRCHRPLFYAICLLTILYSLIDYQLFYAMLVSHDFNSIRSLWPNKGLSLSDSFEKGKIYLFLVNIMQQVFIQNY